MQCEIFEGENALAVQAHRCHRDAIRECADCGKKLCRQHAEYCCDQFWCEFCLGLHQTSEAHVPKEEVVEV